MKTRTIFLPLLLLGALFAASEAKALGYCSSSVAPGETRDVVVGGVTFYDTPSCWGTNENEYNNLSAGGGGSWEDNYTPPTDEPPPAVSGEFVTVIEIDNDASHGSIYDTVTRTNGPLSAGAEEDVAVDYTFPSYGTWYYRVCTDATEIIGESNESNNCTSWQSITLEQPDLRSGATTYTDQYATLGTPYVLTGTPFTFNSSVTNDGGASASGFPNMFWIENVALFAANALSLSPGQTSGISGSYTFNTPGIYNVQSCADYNTSWGTTVAESNENNNCGGWLGVSVVPQAPTGFTASCNASGNAINFSWNASAGSSFYYVRVSSPDGTCPSGWQHVWGSTCIPNPDQWYSTSVANYPVSSGQTYYYGAHGALSNGAWGPYNGSSIACNAPPANLQVSNLAPSGTVPMNQSISFGARVRNVGSTAAANVQTSFQICDDNCAGMNILIPASVAASVTPGGTADVSESYTFTSSGQRHYRACTDTDTSWNQYIPESDDNDNCDGWTTIQVAPPVTQCNDGVDNDGDGNVDGNDAGCGGDDTESGEATASLSATPSLVSAGEAATLSWSSSNTSSCTGTGFSTGGATSGSVSTGALASTQTYQVNCAGSGGSANDFETVTVVTPTASITAQPTLVKSGGSTNLVWSATEVSSCSISATPAGPSFTSSYAPVTPGQNTTAVTNITKQTDFTLSCITLSGGNVSSSVQVNVRFDSDEF